MHMTDLALRALPFSDVQRDYTDDVLPGLTVRVGKRTKTFMLKVGGRTGRRHYTLGRYPDLSLQEARTKAKGLIGDHAKDNTTEGPRIPNLLVLTITTNATHMANMISHLSRVTTSHEETFLFKAKPEFGVNWMVPAIMNDLLTEPWARTSTPFDINRP